MYAYKNSKLSSDSRFFLFSIFFQYVIVQLMWVSLHFLFWDYSETLPTEELTWANMRAFLASKETAILNQLAVWGTVNKISTQQKT